LVADRISQTDCRRHGFILDGYPRSVEQAAKLTRSLAARDTSIDTVLSLHVCEDELLMRATRRARADDSDEVVLQTRLKMYREQTAPLLDYYGNKLVSVDGSGSIDEVFTRVLRAVGRLRPTTPKDLFGHEPNRRYSGQRGETSSGMSNWPRRGQVK
jgi:adenylate kinase